MQEYRHRQNNSVALSDRQRLRLIIQRSRRLNAGQLPESGAGWKPALPGEDAAQSSSAAQVSADSAQSSSAAQVSADSAQSSSAAQVLADAAQSSSAAQVSADSAGRGRQWLVSPVFDMLFICGVAPWLLGFVAFFLVNGTPDHPSPSYPQHFLSILFVAASLIIGESHQFTSIIRYYTGRHGRSKSGRLNRMPFWLIYAGVAFIAMLFASQIIGGHSIPAWAIMPVELLIFVTQFATMMFPVVLMQHVCAQAKGIGLMYCGKAGYRLSTSERRMLSVVTWLLVIAGALTIATPFRREQLIEVSLFEEVAACFVPLAVAAVAYFAAKVVIRGLRTGQWMPAGAGLMWANLAAFILLPLPTIVYVWVFVPLFFHATQHWSVAWITQKKEAAAQGRSLVTRHDRFREMFQLMLPVQAVTLLVLFFPMLFQHFSAPQNVDLSQGFGLTLTVGFSMFVFYLHYFADRIVWRPQ